MKLAGRWVQCCEAQQMMTRLGSLLVAFGVLIGPARGWSADSPFEVTLKFAGGFHIYGWPPVPQVDGFDYYFTPVGVDTCVRGQGVSITSVEVESFGTNGGDVVNWDWEIHVGAADFGLPAGQFVKTTVDPVSGYSRIAPTQVLFAIGNKVDSQSYPFSGSYDFTTDTIQASPYLAQLKAAFTSPANMLNGLHAQLFFWTADNRNCYIDFGDITLTVRGTIQDQLLGLGVSPGDAGKGDNVTFKTCGGEPGMPVILFLTSVDGIPNVLPISSGLIDAQGTWSFSSTVPDLPFLPGTAWTFRDYSIDASGRVVSSNDAILTFH